MMRTRLLVTIGTVSSAVGLAVGGSALVWLSSQTGLATEFVMTGQQYKTVSMANLGVSVGTLILLSGIAAVVLGLAFRPRVTEMDL